MSEISIQVRRVTERVKAYYRIFGFRSNAVMNPGRSVIRGSRRLGFDEIECVVADTARGTSVGFYPVNSLQGLLYGTPFFLLIILQILNNIETPATYISGEKALWGINWQALFLGQASSSFSFYLIFTIFGFLPLLVEILHQRIRLSNLKARFSFFTRDAIWDAREAPSNLLALKTMRSILNHIWILAIIYFATFALPQETQQELYNLYNTSSDAIYSATLDAFTITAGFVIGLLSADKAINLRKENAKIDGRSRISGGILERRFDPVLYGLEAASYSVVAVILFLSVTFFVNSPMIYVFQLVIFSLLGGTITGLIHSESPLWISSSYGITIFFTSLYFIFQTGEQPAFAFVVILQLFILPLPFILMVSRSFQGVLKQNGINSSDWIYDSLVLLPLISIYLIWRKREKAKKKYLGDLEREVDPSSIDSKIRINKEFLLDRNSPAHRLAMHYFELLLSYTASFTEDSFILIPTDTQLLSWWENKSKKKSNEIQADFLNFVDRLLWDPDFNPDEREIGDHERIASKMVLVLQE